VLRSSRWLIVLACCALGACDGSERTEDCASLPPEAIGELVDCVTGSIADTSERGDAVLGIALRQIETGATGEARASLRKAAEILMSVQQKRRREVTSLAILAAGQDQAGDAAGSQETFGAALEAALRIDDERDAKSVLGLIGKRQGSVGNFDAALATLRRIEDDFERSFYVSSLAKSQAKAGDIDGALAVARSMEGEEAQERDLALMDIVAVQVERGDITGALATIQTIDADWDPEGFFGSDMRLMALGPVIKAQIKNGGRDAAMATGVEYQKSQIDLNIRLEHMAIAYAELGMISEARSTDKYPGFDWKFRTRLRVAIANQQIETGDLAGARTSIGSALEAARHIDEETEELVELNESDGGPNTDAGNEGLREAGDKALRDIARSQADMGDIDAALATARRITNASTVVRLRADALTHIAEIQAAAWGFPGATSTARSIATGPSGRPKVDRRRSAGVLATVVEEGVRAGRMDEMLSVARSIPDESYQSIALASIAVALGNAGSREQALAIASEIDYSQRRTLALFQILTEPDASGLLLEDGMAAYERADYSTAVSILRPLAHRGVADAQTQLGRMYLREHGFALDDTEALRWFRRAAEQEDAAAQSNIGAMYAEGRGVRQDFEESVRWYRKAADQGNAIAQYNLALMYGRGQGVPQDDAEAMHWIRMAAEQGLEAAQALIPQIEQPGIIEGGEP